MRTKVIKNQFGDVLVTIDYENDIVLTQSDSEIIITRETLGELFMTIYMELEKKG